MFQPPREADATHMTNFFAFSASDEGTSSPLQLRSVGPTISSRLDVIVVPSWTRGRGRRMERRGRMERKRKRKAEAENNLAFGILRGRSGRSIWSVLGGKQPFLLGPDFGPGFRMTHDGR